MSSEDPYIFVLSGYKYGGNKKLLGIYNNKKAAKKAAHLYDDRCSDLHAHKTSNKIMYALQDGLISIRKRPVLSSVKAIQEKKKIQYKEEEEIMVNSPQVKETIQKNELLLTVLQISAAIVIIVHWFSLFISHWFLSTMTTSFVLLCIYLLKIMQHVTYDDNGKPTSASSIIEGFASYLFYGSVSCISVMLLTTISSYFWLLIFGIPFFLLWTKTHADSLAALRLVTGH